MVMNSGTRYKKVDVNPNDEKVLVWNKCADTSLHEYQYADFVDLYNDLQRNGYSTLKIYEKNGYDRT